VLAAILPQRCKNLKQLNHGVADLLFICSRHVFRVMFCKVVKHSRQMSRSVFLMVTHVALRRLHTQYTAVCATVRRGICRTRQSNRRYHTSPPRAASDESLSSIGPVSHEPDEPLLANKTARTKSVVRKRTVLSSEDDRATATGNVCTKFC